MVYLLQLTRSDAVAQTTETVEDWQCDMGEFLAHENHCRQNKVFSELISRYRYRCWASLEFFKITGADFDFSRIPRGRYERRFGKALDEDVKIGVILALAPSSAQNHCRLHQHILKSYMQVWTMLFDKCRSQADVAA